MALPRPERTEVDLAPMMRDWTDFPQAGQKLATAGSSFPQEAQNAIAIPSYENGCLRIAQDPSHSVVL